MILRSPDGRRARDVVALAWIRKKARRLTLGQLQQLIEILKESIAEDEARAAAT